MVCDRVIAAGLPCDVCRDLDALLDGLGAGAGVAVISQEALDETGTAALLSALDGQEPWSDVPVLLLTMPVSKRPSHAHPAVALLERANVTLLQRPLQTQLFL